jgi:hypothetical protein
MRQSFLKLALIWKLCEYAARDSIMRVLACLGFVLAATTAQAETWTTTTNSESRTVTNYGSGYTTTTNRVSRSSTTTTTYRTASRPHGYQPMGPGGYHPFSH